MSEDLDLNAVASASMSESKPSETTAAAETTTAVTPEESVTEAPKVEKPATQVTNQSQSTPQQKLSRRQAAAKEAAEFRARAEQRDLENRRRIETYEKQLKELEPIKPFLSDIQKAMQAKKQQELAQQFQQNPQAALEQRTQEMIQQALLPYQQQIQQQELKQFADQSINQIKQLAGGEENYKLYSPIMSGLLNNIMQTDPDASDKLAKNPEILFRIARDIYNEQNQAQVAQQQQQTQLENQKSKAEIAKLNGGVSKPNRFTKTPIVQGKDAVKENAFNFIKELTGQK